MFIAIQHLSHCQWQAHCRRYLYQCLFLSSIPCQTSQNGAGEPNSEDGSLGTRPWKSYAELLQGSSGCVLGNGMM